LLYYVAKIIMGPALACYFRRSWHFGADRIPRKGPVVVISNHSASFLDAMLMGVMLRRPIHYYVRGDIFQKRWVRAVFSSLHMMPLFSADLAREQLHRNAESFNRGEEVLRRGGLLLIFPEGLSRMERNAMPFRKGVSRIVLQALASDPGMTVTVVPIGIHYVRHEILSEVQLTTGNVVEVSDKYRALYAEQGPRAIAELTRELEASLRAVSLYVSRTERSPLLESELAMADNDRPGPFTMEHFREQKRISARVDALGDAQAEGLAHMQQQYAGMLDAQGVSDEVVAGNKGLLWPAILLLAGLPFFLLSMVNYPPYLFGKWIADTRVTREDFYTSVITAVSAFSYLIWWGLLCLAAWWSGNFFLVLWAMLSPLLGWFGTRWWQGAANWVSRLHYRRASPEFRAGANALRKRIMDMRTDL